MLKFLLPLVFVVSGCSIHPRISRMEHYSKDSGRAIIYGGISGIPDGYSCVLHFDYRDHKAQVRRVSREMTMDDKGAKDSVLKYAFFLPPGRWTLRQIDLMGLKESGESTLVRRVPKEALALFRMQDSLGAGFGFDAAKDGLHYLGRWGFGGFETLDALLPEAMARFDASQRNASDSSRHSIRFSLSVEDSSESDFVHFQGNHPALRSKKSRPAIPAYPPGQVSHAFDLLIANPESQPNFARDFGMRHMMEPRIPKF